MALSSILGCVGCGQISGCTAGGASDCVAELFCADSVCFCPHAASVSNNPPITMLRRRQQRSDLSFEWILRLI